MNISRHNRASQVTLSLLRIVSGFLFSLHGFQKLFAVLGREEAAELLSRAWFAGVLETIGGPLVMLGLFTRPVAFILAGEMAAAYFLSHLPRGFWPIINRGELAALYSFLFLFLAAHGGGRFSIDTWLQRRLGKRS
jgi:putative oxidoreductase